MQLVFLIVCNEQTFLLILSQRLGKLGTNYRWIIDFRAPCTHYYRNIAHSSPKHYVVNKIRNVRKDWSFHVHTHEGTPLSKKNGERGKNRFPLKPTHGHEKKITSCLKFVDLVHLKFVFYSYAYNRRSSCWLSFSMHRDAHNEEQTWNVTKEKRELTNKRFIGVTFYIVWHMFCSHKELRNGKKYLRSMYHWGGLQTLQTWSQSKKQNILSPSCFYSSRYIKSRE